MYTIFTSTCYNYGSVKVGWIHGEMEGECLTKRTGALTMEGSRISVSEMGGLHKERFGSSGLEWRMRARKGVSADGWWTRSE